MNMSTGQTRDLDRPLVEVDLDARWHVCWAQQVFGVYISAIFAYGVLSVLLGVVVVVVLVAAMK
jgi:hypothetical protein